MNGEKTFFPSFLFFLTIFLLSVSLVDDIGDEEEDSDHDSDRNGKDSDDENGARARGIKGKKREGETGGVFRSLFWFLIPPPSTSLARSFFFSLLS